MNNFQRRIQRDFSSPFGGAEPASDIPEGTVIVAGRDGEPSSSGVASTDLTGKMVTGGDSHAHASGDGAAIDYDDITNKPASFTPASHEHSAADLTSGTLNASRLPAAYTGTRQVVLDIWDNGTQLVKRVQTETWVNGVLTNATSPADILVDTLSNVCPTPP